MIITTGILIIRIIESETNEKTAIVAYTTTMGTILQRYKTGDEKVTDTLSDQIIPRFIVSHFYSAARKVSIFLDWPR